MADITQQPYAEWLEASLRELVELHPEEFGDAWDFAFACQQAMCEAADAIENMSEAYEKLSRHMDDLAALMPRWIPVSEKLPGYGDKCLAVIRRDDGKQRIGISYCFVQREGFWSDKGAEGDSLQRLKSRQGKSPHI